MELTQISEAIRRDAAWIVFLNVLLQQAGLPVPAVPTLLLAGSLAMSWGLVGQVLAAAVLASVVADWLWFLAGRAFGYRVLSGLCRLSINPGSCVSETERRFLRWGLWSLVGAKFLPGFSTVAPPIAGALRMPLPSFLGAAGLGAALWAGTALWAGWLLRSEVNAAIALLDQQGALVLAGALGFLGLWVGWRFWQKRRFERLAAMPRITPAELLAALAAEPAPLLLDLRGPAMIAETGPIEGALVVALEQLERLAEAWPKDRPIVTLCACPQDATAVKAARALQRRGHASVRPLAGGYEAWVAATRDTRASDG
ncbi:VTT domain-containing protein [Ramlibacter sp. 2FC]|uniref:VTT domain-containing protein n=1 Tax=Ramlibacter sp. 2FC TaxID=2502188 RepID=UPI0010F72350|nr:VTT domain-containing protein [Ramlibacter sp. 2FC]